MFCKVVRLIILFTGVNSAVHLPPEITKCSKTDPQFSECMKKSVIDALKYFKDGYKELGFPRLEPYHIEKLEITTDSGQSVKLDQKYENVDMYGMVDAEVKMFKLMDDGNNNCKWEMEILTYGSRMEADYVLSGQVLVFPINGRGRCNVTLEAITSKHMAECEHYTKKGKTHMRLKNYKIDMSVGKSHFDFPNIVPGNEQISNEVGKTINENSLEIFQEVKGGFEEILTRLHESVANSFFSRIPEDELFLP